MLRNKPALVLPLDIPYEQRYHSTKTIEINFFGRIYGSLIKYFFVFSSGLYGGLTQLAKQSKSIACQVDANGQKYLAKYLSLTSFSVYL